MNAYTDLEENNYYLNSDNLGVVMYTTKKDVYKIEGMKMELSFEFPDKSENDNLIRAEVKAVMVSALKELLQKKCI